MDIIVVLGKRLNDDSTMTDELINRLNLGISLINDKIGKIAVCGGIPNKKAGISEASQMYKYLVDKGINKDMIIREEKSLTTLGNAIYFKRILKKLKIKVDALYLVSTKYHFNRKTFNCFRIFKRYFRKSNVIKCES